MTSSPPARDTVTTAEAAELLGCHVRTVHRMIARGELPATKAHNGLRAPYLIPSASITATGRVRP